MSEAAEIVPGRLYALGGTVPVDERISWLPPGRGGHESLNAYLLLEGDDALLVDTGVAYHRELVLDQLRALLPAGTRLRVFLTRAEADCLTNLDGIMTAFPISQVYAGGVHNPFDFFDEIIDEISRRKIIESYELQVTRKVPGEHITVGDGRELVIVDAPIRLLTTFWAYDAATGVLFTSDAFGHVGLADAGGPRVLGEDSGSEEIELAREWLLTKFDWFQGADTRPIREELAAVFAAYEVTALAPVHGCVLRGRETVRRHVARVDEVLADVGV